MTLSLSQNGWPLASLNGYEAVKRTVSSQTLDLVLLFVGIVVVLLGCTIVLMVKNPAAPDVETLPIPDPNSVEFDNSEYNYESATTIQ